MTNKKIFIQPKTLGELKDLSGLNGIPDSAKIFIEDSTGCTMLQWVVQCPSCLSKISKLCQIELVAE